MTTALNIRKTHKTSDSQAPRAETRKQNIYRNQWGICRGKGNLNCNWQIIGDSVWTTQSLEVSGNLVTGLAPHFWVLPPGVHPGSLCEYLTKHPSCIQQLEGKGPFWNTPVHSVLPNKVCPKEKLFKQNLTCWGSIKRLTELKVGK